MSNRMKKKLQKKTSYQKTKEEFEKIKEKRKKKKEVITVFLLGKKKDYCLFFLHICCVFIQIPGISQKQAAERRSHQAVQAEKDGNVSNSEQKDQERTAEPQPADGLFTSEDPRKAKMMTKK